MEDPISLQLGVALVVRDGSMGLGQVVDGPFVVPDSALKFRVEFARCTAVTPQLWPDKATTLQWHVYQEEFEGAHYHGNSTAHGGVVIAEGGQEEPCSWDETPLKPGVRRTVFVMYEFSDEVKSVMRVIAK